MTASVIVAVILVAGILVLAYSYAMVRHSGNFSSKSIDVKKSVDSIKHKVETRSIVGAATGGSGGPTNGGPTVQISQMATLIFLIAGLS